MVHDISNHKDLLAATTHASSSTPQHSPARRVEEQVHASPPVDGATTKQEIERAVAQVREVFQNADSRVEFSVDPDLDRVVVKILDGESGTVIRQIPQQEVIELAKRLERPTGLLLHHKV